MKGNTTRFLANHVKKRGFRIVAAHALHTPENYPPVIKMDHGYINHPTKDQLEDFNAFIEELRNIIIKTGNKENLNEFSVKVSPFLKVLPDIANRKMIHYMIKDKKIDANNCTKCGLCVKACAYGAVEMKDSDYPTFDEKKCYGCFACYNKCPGKAIYTNKYHKFGHYPKPNYRMEKIFKITEKG